MEIFGRGDGFRNDPSDIGDFLFDSGSLSLIEPFDLFCRWSNLGTIIGFGDHLDCLFGNESDQEATLICLGSVAIFPHSYFGSNRFYVSFSDEALSAIDTSLDFTEREP